VTGSACDSICDSLCVCRFAIEMWSLAVNCESDVDVCANGDCKFATADACVEGLVVAKPAQGSSRVY